MDPKIKALVSRLIACFLPSKNDKIKEKAILFEKSGKSRTFFIFDEDAEHLAILAYFTIALQVLKIPENYSNNQIKRFDGFNAKIGGKKILELPTILIGQFAFI